MQKSVTIDLESKTIVSSRKDQFLTVRSISIYFENQKAMVNEDTWRHDASIPFLLTAEISLDSRLSDFASMDPQTFLQDVSLPFISQ